MHDHVGESGCMAIVCDGTDAHLEQREPEFGLWGGTEHGSGSDLDPDLWRPPVHSGHERSLLFISGRTFTVKRTTRNTDK